MSLLVIAARCHSPEPSLTQKGMSEKTLLLFWSRMGRGGLQGEQRRALSPSRAAALFHCCFLRQVLPPPWARGARPNDGKVIHHWSTTAANWISPPPINMQSCLAKVSRKGWWWWWWWGGGVVAGVKVGRGVRGWGIAGWGGSRGWERLPAFLLEVACCWEEDGTCWGETSQAWHP